MAREPSLSATQLAALDFLYEQRGEALDGCKKLGRRTAESLHKRGLIEPLSGNLIALFRRWMLTEQGRAARVRAHELDKKT